MKIAFLYGGQGSQEVGMGKDLYHEVPEAKAYYDSLQMDFPLTDISFNGDLATLSQTEYTQPCMLAYFVTMTDYLRRNGITPTYTAGLSIGEYASLYVSGVLSAQQVVKTARLRGSAMQQALSGHDTAMAAVFGMNVDSLQSFLQSAGTSTLQIANLNCPGQIVIGGARSELDSATPALKEAGAKRIIPLNVSGAFHTAYMNPAATALKAHFAEISWHDMEIPIVFNLLGREKKADENIQDIMIAQVKSPVLFEASVEYLLSQGVDTFVEIGFGKVLAGFIRKIDRQAQVFGITTKASADEFIELIKNK